MLADQACLLPMHTIRTIADHVRPAGLPTRPGQHEPGALAGLRAIGGQILPVIDPRAALGLPQVGAPTVDIVVAAPGLPSFVLPADSVDGVVRLLDGAVHDTGRRAIIGAVTKLDGRLGWLLAPAALAATAGEATRPEGSSSTAIFKGPA